MKYSLFFWLIAALLVSSCDKPAMMELPKNSPRLGIHAMWDRNQTLEVLVTRTVTLAEEIRFDDYTIESHLKQYSISNATVTVYKDGMAYDELVYDPGKYVYKSITGRTANPDARYSIRVSAPGYKEVISPVAAFPQQIPIKSLVLTANAGSQNSSPVHELEVAFDDPAAEKNYYWVTLTYQPNNPSNHTYYSPVYVTPVDNDIIMPPGSDVLDMLPTIAADRILLKDDNFNGQTKRLKLQLSSWYFANTGNPPIILSLNHVGEDVFKYQRSRILDSQDPFATPVQTFSNMTNGLGIFGLYASDQRALH